MNLYEIVMDFNFVIHSEQYNCVNLLIQTVRGSFPVSKCFH